LFDVQSIDLKKAFGGTVRVWRNRLGLSQEELGGRAGLHRTYVSDIERGSRNVSLESMEKLADALQVSVGTLFSNPAEPPPQNGNQSVIEILLVEDSPIDITLAKAALKASGVLHRIEVATDGAAALTHVFGPSSNGERRAPVRRPDLILLDLGLPKVDGMEVLRIIKGDERTRSIPVVVLTASSSDQDLDDSRRLGADGYLTKPVDLTGLSKITPRLSLKWALLAPNQLA
jgi:CheY-like chemotaxis protein